MKVLKIILITLLCLLLLVVIGGFIFLKTFDIKKYKTQIVTAADKALGRHLDFNDIELKVSLKEGIRFHVTDVTISENPAFGTEDFFKVKEVYLGVDILSFLNSRQVSIPSVLIKSPQVTVIQNAAGALNVQSIGKSSATSAQGYSTVSGSVSSSSSNANSAAALPAIFINSIRIENAGVHFVDLSVDPSFKADVSGLTLKVDRFSLNKPFDFALEAAVLSSVQNFKLDGTVDLNILTKDVRLSDMHIWFDLGQLPLQELGRLPALKGVPLPEVLEGKYTATIKECVVSEKGLGSITLDTQLDSGKVVMKEVAPGISLDVSQINLAVKDFSLGKPFDFALKAAYMADVPNIDVKGSVDLDMTTQNVRLSNLVFNTDLGLWPLAKLNTELAPLKDVPLPQKLGGLLQVVVSDLAAGPQGLGDFKLDVALKAGDVSFKEVAPGVNFDATKIDLSVNGFSLKLPFTVALKMAYLNELPNINLQGTVDYGMTSQMLRLDNFRIGVDLGLLSMEQLKSSIVQLQNAPLPDVLGGTFDATIKTLKAGPQGLESVLADAHLSNGKISMTNVAPGVSFKASHIDFQVNDVSLSKPFMYQLRMAYLNDAPNISSAGIASYNMQTQEVGLKDNAIAIDLATLNLAELKASVSSLQTVPFPDILTGNMNMVIKDLTAGPKGLGAMLVDMNLDKGSVSIKDVAPGISVALAQIGLDVKDISLNKTPMPIRFKAAYVSDQPNLDFTGTAAFDMAQSSVELKDASFKTDLSLWSMERLKSSVQSLKDVPLPEVLKGLFNVQIDTMAAGPKGLTSLQTHGDLSAATIKLKELKLPVIIPQLKFAADGTNAKLDDIVIELGKGTIKAKAAIDQYLIKPILHAEGTVDGLDLAEVLDQKDAPMQVQGLVYVSMNIEGDPSNLNSLTGGGTFELKDGVLKGLNVIKTVFDSIKLPLLPNLSGMVMSALPEEYRKQFEKPDTDLKSVKASAVIAQGFADLSSIDVESDLFIYKGTGKVGFDQTYKTDGEFSVTKDLSALLVKDLENPFSYMRNEQNLVSFPVPVSGPPPKFEPVTVLTGMVENAVKSKGKEELGKFFNKMLEKNGIQTTQPQTTETPESNDNSTSPADQTDQAPADGSSQAEPQKSTGEQLVDGIFGTIFK